MLQVEKVFCLASKMLSRIASLALFIVAFSESYGFHSLGSIRLSKSHFGHFFKQTLKMSDADSGEEGSLWQERVKYVDLSAVKESPSPDARELPLFLLGGAFYPEGTTFLNVFEMKYRCEVVGQFHQIFYLCMK